MAEKLNIVNRKYATIKENAIKSIQLSLATSEDVLEWSHGVITKPETINYKTFKPEKGGLFDEVVFGPMTDYKCPICSTKYKRTNEGQICEKSDECKIVKPEILPKSSRRNRMGHIELASPVVHFWYFKVDHSIIAKLLGLRAEGSNKAHSKSAIESLIYFKSHIVLESGGIVALPKNHIININVAAITYRNALIEIREKYEEKTESYEELTFAIEELEETARSKIGKDYGIDFYELNEIIERHSDARISTGAKAIEFLLDNLNLKAELAKVKRGIAKINKAIKDQGNIAETKINDRAKLYKRLAVINAFIKSGQDPKTMLITHLPIIPADLRPLVQLEAGRHSTTDVNELYRRIIIRNNRLFKWIELEAPVLIIQNEMRMLQEAIDALIDNSRKKPSPVLSKDNRPLKSIADALTGKTGRFRQNLLGKRVDYSGRSVIVVGPDLKMHQAGIPRGMAAKLFEPWIVKQLIEDEVATSIKAAKKLIEEQNLVIWPYVEKSIEGKIVLLNRAPTLHRLSVQAFEPVLVRGKAMKLHPLVTTAFNADFDGDQMAVHVPISDEAQREAKELMLANKNILGPKDGEPIINPSQDMILGLFYLTIEVKDAKGEGKYFGSLEDMHKAYANGIVNIHARVAIPASKLEKHSLINKSGYVVSTVGKFIFNEALPTSFPFVFNGEKETLTKVMSKNLIPLGSNIVDSIKALPIEQPLNKKNIATIVRKVFDQYVAVIGKEDVASVISIINQENYADPMIFANLLDDQHEPINKIHALTLSKYLVRGFEKLNKRIALANEGVERFFEVEEKAELLEFVWFRYTNAVADVLDKIKTLGFKYSMLSGASISIGDIETSNIKAKVVKDGDEYITKLKEMYRDGLITDDERYTLTISKWSKVKDEIQQDLKSKVQNKPSNPIFMMMESGARGNISNFVQLAGLRGLMANNSKVLKAFAESNKVVRSTVEVPVKSSFLEGLTGFEFYSSTHGARKGLTDTALNTAKSGYLTRKLVDLSQNIVVKEEDCGSDHGFIVKNIVDTKTNSIITPLEDRLIGRFTLKQVVNSKGNIIVEPNTLITEELALAVAKANITSVTIRSVLGCHTKNGVCKKDYGIDLATNRVVNIGEAVGIIAAQSIGEPGTQLTMRTFHTGGVAGVDDITGGFSKLIELIDAYNKPWGRPAIISKTRGRVLSIEPDEINSHKTIICVEAYDHDGNTVKEYAYKFDSQRRIRVKKGDKVKQGQKLVEGPIILKELLEYADVREVQNYLIKELQRLYRMQGIAIQDKYLEIVVRQMLSKLIITDPGQSHFFAGAVVDINDYSETNAKLLTQSKIPSYGVTVIKGAKQAPLLSSSFLAAASYQETAKILVHASISSKVDALEGLKENLLVGHKIPAGTGYSYEEKGKFDIRDPKSYFENQ